MIEITFSVGIAIIAVVVGSTFGSLVSHVNPLTAFVTIIKSSLGESSSIIFTLSLAAPILIASTGILIAFRTGLWNIGGEGQIYLGAIAGLATAVGLSQTGWNGPQAMPLIFMAAFATGGVWASIAGFLKIKFRIDEIVSTLMLNYVGINIVQYLIRVPYRGSQFLVTPVSLNIPYNLPSFDEVSLAVPVALAIALIVHFAVTRTTFGLRSKLVGENPVTAVYAGVNMRLYTMVIMFLSGGLLGVTGIVLLSGYDHFIFTGMSNNYGYLSIAVALLATVNAIALIPASIFFALLFTGAYGLMVNLAISSSLSLVIGAIAILFTAARPDLLERFKNRFVS